MNFEQICSIVLACLVSAGGIGTVVVALVKFACNLIVEKLSKEYDVKLSKELESYKANVDNKIYISKTKFNTEFELYRELSRKYTSMVKETMQLFPRFNKNFANDYDQAKILYDNAIATIIEAQDALYASAAFISLDLYNQFNEIENLCKRQLNEFENYRLSQDIEKRISEKRLRCGEAYKRTSEINQKFNKLIEDMRNYISRLDVIE